MIIRKEREDDRLAVREIHRLAFSGDAEGKLVDDLRDSGDAAISLVAEQEGQIVGHVLFSKLEAPMRALALAPVGVEPSFQMRGIGSALIREGLACALNEDWEAIFVLGAPDYYERFGFDVAAARAYGCPYSGEHFMVRFMGTGKMPEGRLVYPTAFGALG